MALFIRFYPWPDVESVVTCDSHLAIEQQQLLNVYGMLVEVGLQSVVELPRAEFLWTTVADVYFSKRIGLPPSKLGMVKQIFRVAALTGSAVDVLIKLLMNTESVRLAECTSLCSTKGELLIANFSDEIALILCTNAELFLKHLKEASRCQPDVVGRALFHTVSVVVHSSDLRKKYGRELALQILQIFGQELLYWADVVVSNETLKMLWLKLMMKLILIDSKITEWPEFAPMASAYFMLLNDQSLTLDFKNRMLSLLAGFCTFDRHACELGRSLKLFMVNNFPLKSDEFAKGTAKYDQYVAACQKILFAFGCTGSPIILELLLSMVCREQSHPIASDLKHQLQKFSSRANSAVLENILELLDKMFFNPSSCVCPSLRLALLNEFFIPFLHSLKNDLLLTWTCRKIQTLVSCLTESLTLEIQTDCEQQLITKIGCYKICAIIYNELDLECLKNEVNVSYLGSDSQMKNELIKKLVSCAVGAKKEFCRDSKLDSIQKHFFEYRCAAQNCVIALVKKTQSHLKHYEGFIFNDCWESIIDKEVKYEFDREIQEEEQSAGKMYYSRQDRPSSAEYENQVELSVLLDSSLSVMATQFDFTESLEARTHCAETRTESANDKDVFRPFYLEWISPIIKLIVMDEFGSNILHYFRVDLIVVLFEWTAHLKEHCWSKSGKVFKRNLRIIETMLVLWKSLILEKICFPLGNENENVCGISILCLCLNTVPETFSFLTDPNYESGFCNDLLDWFPSLHGDLKTACLEGFFAVSKYKGDFFEELKSRGFLKVFSLRYERDQMLGMYIVKNLHANLTVENISDLVSSFSSVIGNFSPSCRRAFAEMCCSLYTKLSSLNDSSENSKAALATTKMHLLTMLSDSNKSIRQLVYNFWCDASRLEISTSARLLNCLSQLYTCATESTFLSHASYVMLELTCHSPDYTRLIYDHPLEDCTFENLPISTHWQSRYASLEVPAYMQTDMHSEKNVGNISADTFELDLDESDSSDNLTVILDKILQDIKKPKSSRVKKVDDLDGDLQFLKNRILKDTEEKAFFVNLNRKRQKVIERLKQQSLDLRGKYRRGDFPDIQIPYSAVIITLQAVAELDRVFAGALFESLMCGVAANVIEIYNFEMTEKYFDSISDGLRDIFRSMVTFHRPLVSCLMNFLYNFIEYVHFEPTDIANVAIGSGQPDCGIVLLERRIEVGFVDISAVTCQEKRLKQVNETDRLWVELARLYKQCGELENLKAVFTKHLLTTEKTKLALEMEAAGDFEGAATIYGETFSNKQSKSGDIVEKAESNLLYEARIRCLEMLNDWKGLETWSTTFSASGKTAKLNQIWETDYLINMHLPVFLRSKLKIALTSDSAALEELSAFVEQNQTVPKNREILENRHSGLLVLLNILREDFTKSQYFLNVAIDSFLKCYPTLRVCDVTARLKLVQDLLPVSETAKFLHLLHASEHLKLESVVRLCRFWLRYGLDVETTLTTTADDVVLNRKTFLEIFGKGLVNSGISVSDVRQSLLPFRLQFGYQYLKCAVRQNNHGVVFSLLSSIKKLLQRLQDKHLLLEASNYETWALLQLANCANAVKSRTAYLMQALNLFDLKRISDPEVNVTEGSSADQFALIGMLFDNVAETVVASSENTLAEFCLSRWISKTDTADISELVTMCYGQAFRYLKLSCQYSSQLNIESPKLTEPLMELSSFCDRILRKNGHTSLVNSECACVMVRSILKSMKNGSHLARQLFPRLLSVMEKYPESELEFQAEIDSVPSWMFLSWMNQMLSALKRSNKFYSILERIADDYPQALIYPLLMLKSATGDVGETDFYRLQLKLRKTKIVKEFIDALNLLSHPDIVFKHAIDELESIILNISNNSNEARKEAIAKVYSFVTFADIRRDFLGSFWKCYFKKYLPKMQEIFSVDLCAFDNKAAEVCRSSIKIEFKAILFVVFILFAQHFRFQMH
ncbi:DNA-dependent protein kinase catalytic subunit [Trichinella pseudospiralis]|uniref:DNA-dependent protein kinase catalytic subunit n=1 Tax=Trichinella pseudospiralis TaxID=6337 RepID=A0A0V0XJQ7_TRIPS|nr:DNA-dependent protein kinase catalytic subunit [Trichinella pseudospiralis]KRX88120.1 DNA-dependent protein kinase catalytic subunit [Trichinella pseudospiralis]